MAISISAGMCRNASRLTNVVLDTETGPLEMALSGLVATSVESLSLGHEHPTAELWRMLLRILPCMPNLKVLNIADANHGDREGTLGLIFSQLRHPASSGLKKLAMHRKHLTAVDMGTTTNNPWAMVPFEQANTSLQNLTLARVIFQTPRTVTALWNVVGLHSIYISNPCYHRTVSAGDESHVGYWAEFIRRNKDLCEITVIAGEDDDFLNGILDGACNLISLKKLDVTTEIALDGDAGARLCRILQNPASSMHELLIGGCELERTFTMLLAQGLCQNKSLRILDFESCKFAACAMNEILQSLLVNQTLVELGFKSSDEDAEVIGGETFCQTLSDVFRSNASLVKFTLGKVDLHAGKMSEILTVLNENKTLKVLNFDSCVVDNEAITCLGRALESTDVSLEEIELPTISTDEMDQYKQGLLAFLESLVKMPTIQKVHFGDMFTIENDESRRLLLQAVKKKTNLVVADGYYDIISGDHEAPLLSTMESEMEELLIYLKLNRFGRRLLDSTNIVASLWPRILARMATQPTDADVLFYFLREYFSRQGKEVQHQKHKQQEQQQQQPPHKKARVH